MVIIGKGAEADVFLEDGVVVKKRVSKGYRLKELDDFLRKSRTRSEAKILQRIDGLGPSFIGGNDVDELRMSFVEGVLLKKVLDEDISLAKYIGLKVGKLHDLGIIHGDLTTSNMIFFDGDVKLIDFGLSFFSDKVEDKAVDLHLFKEAVVSKHFVFEKDIWSNFLEGYNPSGKDDIVKRLNVVELRGRNKQKY